jgi:hypothetical protein
LSCCLFSFFLILIHFLIGSFGAQGEELKVEQAEWDDISVISYSDAGVVATLRRAAKPLKDTPQTTDRTITVDFVLLRSVTRGIKVRVLRLACVVPAHLRIDTA